jgi:hypothetical protein
MSAQKRRRRRNPAPIEHPPAWGSLLWPHLDTIRAMRHAHKTWLQITHHLHTMHGITITHRAVRNFSKRVEKAILENRPMPVGSRFPSPVDKPVQAAPESVFDEAMAARPAPAFRIAQAEKPL